MTQALLSAASLACMDAALLTLAAWASWRSRLEVRLRAPAALAFMSATFAIQVWIVSEPHVTRRCVILTIAVGCVAVSAITDALSGYVFDAVTLPALAAMCAVALPSHLWWPVAFGATAASGALGLLHGSTRGRGLGFGDVKLAACIGGALGARDALIAIGAAFVLGGAYAAYLLISGRGKRGDAIAFAPYLAAGMVAVASFRMAP